MNVFSGNLRAIQDAVYTEQDRKGTLGVIPGDEHDVQVKIVDGAKTNFQSEMQTQSYDVLIYAHPDTVLDDENCVGGVIHTPRKTYRVEAFYPVVNQRTGQVEHVELGCSQI